MNFNENIIVISAENKNNQIKVTTDFLKNDKKVDIEKNFENKNSDFKAILHQEINKTSNKDNIKLSDTSDVTKKEEKIKQKKLTKSYKELISILNSLKVLLQNLESIDNKLVSKLQTRISFFNKFLNSLISKKSSTTFSDRINFHQFFKNLNSFLEKLKIDKYLYNKIKHLVSKLSELTKQIRQLTKESKPLQNESNILNLDNNYLSSSNEQGDDFDTKSHQDNLLNLMQIR